MPRASAAGLSNGSLRHGDASDLEGIADRSFDLVVGMFGARFAPRPFDVAKQRVCVIRPGGRIVMGTWIPDDPTVVGQIPRIGPAYAPPPRAGFVGPMTWGVPANVVARPLPGPEASCAGAAQRPCAIRDGRQNEPMMRTRLPTAAGLALSASGLLAAPICDGAAPIAAPGDAVYRALTTGAGLESAAPLRAALRSLWPAFAGDADCESEAVDSGAPPGLQRLALANGSWLVQAVCAQGAYQGSGWMAQLWAAPGGVRQAALLCWPVPTERAGRLTLEDRIVVWGEPSVAAPNADGAAGAPATEVEIVERFRAIGDCGTRSRYRLERGRVTLVGIAGALACPETAPDPPTGPADWPTLAIPPR